MGYTNKSTIYSMGLEEVLLLVVTSNQNRFAFEKGKQTGETQVETKGKKKRKHPTPYHHPAGVRSTYG